MNNGMNYDWLINEVKDWKFNSDSDKRSAIRDFIREHFGDDEILEILLRKVWDDIH